MRGILGAKLDFISESSNGLMVTIELTPPLHLKISFSFLSPFYIKELFKN